MMRKLKKQWVILGIIISMALIAILGYRKYISDHVGRVMVKGDYEYELLWNAVVITKYNGSEEIVKVPDKFLFRPVTKIEENAFTGNRSIKEVSLPATVSWIDDQVFMDCESLEKINFPHGLYYIGRRAFCNCVKLKEMEMSYDDKQMEGTIHYAAFQNCTGLEKVDFHDCNVYIGGMAFQDCTSLSDVEGYNNITICRDTFENTEFMANWDDDSFFYANDRLIMYWGDESDITVPDWFKEICPDAFCDFMGGEKPPAEISGIHFPDSYNYLNLRCRTYSYKEYGKIKLYFGRPAEFDVNDIEEAAKRYIFVAPADSVVIQYAKDNGIEYIIE